MGAVELPEEIPDSLREIGWVFLYEEDGWDDLMRALKHGMKQRSIEAAHERRQQEEQRTQKEQILKDELRKTMEQQEREAADQQAKARQHAEQQRLAEEEADRKQRAEAKRKQKEEANRKQREARERELAEKRRREEETRIQTFEFETVRLDKNGKEVERRKLQARYFIEDLGNGVNLEMVEIPGGRVSRLAKAVIDHLMRIIVSPYLVFRLREGAAACFFSSLLLTSLLVSVRSCAKSSSPRSISPSIFLSSSRARSSSICE